MMPELGAYDEFAGLPLYAETIGIPPEGVPPARRIDLATRDCACVSGIRWGLEEPAVVYLHGGGQNAHTWDSVAMALGRPALALDLPGHGHSSWRPDRNYTPWANADVVAEVMAQCAPQVAVVVGMSLGGLTLIRLASAYPALTRRALVVDVTPGVSRQVAGMTSEQRGATLLTQGQRVFDSFDEMLDAAAATMPDRSRESLWWGVRHNANHLANGKWEWRYDGLRTRSPVGFSNLWEELSAIRIPLLLVKGGKSAFVGDGDVDEFARRQPSARFEVVPDAGHSVQSDQPLQLASLIEGFLVQD